MKLTTSSATKLSAPLLFITLFLYACLGNTNTDFPSATQVLYSVQGLNQETVRDNDTVNVLNARFVFNNIRLIREGGGTVSLLGEKLIANYSVANQGRPINVSQGELPSGIYSGISFDLVKPDSDPDLENPGSSIVIGGILNGDFFQYDSEDTFSKSLSFDSLLTVQDVNQSLIIQIQPNARNWLVDATDNTILDPNDSANSTKISANAQRSFQIIVDFIGEGQN